MRYLNDLNAASIERMLAEHPAHHSLLALLPESEAAAVSYLQSACRAHGVDLVGALFPGLIVDGDFVGRGGWLLALPPGTPAFMLDALGADAAADAGRLAAEVRRGLSQQTSVPEKPLLFLIFDGLLPNIASMLDELYLQLANRIEYVGANCGSETFASIPCVFDNERIVANGGVGVLLPGRHGGALEHGFPVPGHALAATAASGNCITTIDWRPAFTVYQELLASTYGVTLTAENFYQHGVHFPLGILQASGDVIVRVPVGLREDGALYCIGEIRENAMMVVLQASDIDDSTCVDRLAERMKFDEGSLAGGNLLLFYCAGRRMHHALRAKEEIVRLQRATATARLGGALTTGEIGSLRRNAYPTLQNECLVGLPWSG